MQINFLGDSITEGCGASSEEKRFSTLVCRHFGATEHNFGVGGTRIAKQDGPDNGRWGEYFMLRAVQMPTDVGFTIVFGGTNDFGHGVAPLGKQGDNSQITFYNAFEELVCFLTERFPKQKLAFILPLPRINQDNPRGDGYKAPVAPLCEYIAVEKEILQRYGVDYLDLSDVFPRPTQVPDLLTDDGLHPNDLGYQALAKGVIDYLQDKI